MLLARILPIETQAEIMKKLYEKKKELLRAGTPNPMEINRLQKLLVQDAINKWKVKLNKPSLPGKRIRAAILPNLTQWFSRPHFYGLTYRLTQILAGHGCFADFLYKIGKYNSPICRHCEEEIDNAQHTLEFCPNWEEYRAILKNQIGEDLGLSSVVSRILENKEN